MYHVRELLTSIVEELVALVGRDDVAVVGCIRLRWQRDAQAGGDLLDAAEQPLLLTVRPVVLVAHQLEEDVRDDHGRDAEDPEVVEEDCDDLAGDSDWVHVAVPDSQSGYDRPPHALAVGLALGEGKQATRHQQAGDVDQRDQHQAVCDPVQGPSH
jgi:hypothetical protein